MSERPPDSIHEFTPSQLILIAFLGGIAFALGAACGGWAVWWLVVTTG